MQELRINFGKTKGEISPLLYGHFTEHIGGVFYDGLWVGEDSPIENIHGFRKSLVDSFRKIAPPLVRWPGGCFAETYDWRDGIGKREERPRRVNWWYYCDKRIESNQVGTHEFMDFCNLVGAKPYLAANMTSTTPLHIRNWIEYCNFPAGLTTLSDERAANGSIEPFNVQYWGIGNENWGGGGQMSPEMCAREYVRYTTICRSLGTENLRFIMCGGNGRDLEWTRRLMAEWAKRPWQETKTWGVSIHYYTNWGVGRDDYDFDEAGWYDELYRAAFMEKIIDNHRAAMDPFDKDRQLKLIVDEWGNWHKDGSGPSKGKNLFEQQSSMRDAVVAAVTLNLFNNRCDVVGMANVAQLCNNLHSLYLAGGEHFVETPNYFVFDFFKGHQGGKQLDVTTNLPAKELADGRMLEMVSASASVKDDVLTLTLANLDMTCGKDIAIGGIFGKVTGKGTWSVLTASDPHQCNTFEEPTLVQPKTEEVTFQDGDVLHLPAASVASLTLKLI